MRKKARWTVTDETTDPPALTSPNAQTVTYGKRGGAEATLQWPEDEVVEEGVGGIYEESEGVFILLIDCDSAGTWAIRVEATEGVVAVDEAKWIVDHSSFE